MSQHVFIWFSVFFMLFLAQMVRTNVGNNASEPRLNKTHREIKKSKFNVSLVQYSPLIKSNNSNESVHYLNARNYEKIVETAKYHSADIVIFPEMGLFNHENFNVVKKLPSLRPWDTRIESVSYGYEQASKNFTQAVRSFLINATEEVPHPYKKVKLCRNFNDTRTPLEILACVAKKHQIYIVMHTYEKEKCKEKKFCKDNFNIYSTSVVFNRMGSIIARSRKRDVYDEPWLDSDKKGFKETFKTDFDVTFELLTGTEILRQKPNKPKKVTDVIVYEEDEEEETESIVTMMSGLHNEAPLFITIQDQITWARKSNVKMLVAGYSSGGGGGIYMGHKEPTYRVISNESTNHYIQESIKIPKRREQQKFLHKYKTEDLSDDNKKWYPNEPLSHKFDMKEFIYSGFQTTSDVNDTLEFQVHNLCIRKLCCNFALQVSSRRHVRGVKPYKIKIAAMLGIYQLVDDSLVAIKMCVVLACENDDLSTCAHLSNHNSNERYPFTFKSIVITSRFNPGYTVSLTTAYAMTKDFMLTNDEDFTFVMPEASRNSMYLMHLNIPRSDIMIFGIVWRLYHVERELPMFLVHLGYFFLGLGTAVLLPTIIFVSFHYFIRKRDKRNVNVRRQRFIDQLEIKERKLLKERLISIEERDMFLDCIKKYIDGSYLDFYETQMKMELLGYSPPTLLEALHERDKLRKAAELPECLKIIRPRGRKIIQHVPVEVHQGESASTD